MQVAERERKSYQRTPECHVQDKNIKRLLPTCAGAGKVRDDDGYWKSETISKNIQMLLSHTAYVLNACRK